jgi:hypothetical protein
MTPLTRTPSSRAQVLGRRAHLDAQAGPLEEQHEADHEHEAGAHGDEIELGDADAEHVERLDQAPPELDGLGLGPGDDDREVLQHVADGERRHHQGRGVRSADRPERHPLHAEREQRRAGYRDHDHEHPRGAREQQDQVARDHDELAVGEVDELHDPEDEGDPERDERVQAAEAHCVDQVLNDVLKVNCCEDHAGPSVS